MKFCDYIKGKLENLIVLRTPKGVYVGPVDSAEKVLRLCGYTGKLSFHMVGGKLGYIENEERELVGQVPETVRELVEFLV